MTDNIVWIGTILLVVREIAIAIGLGVLAIVLTLKAGNVNRLAALGVMVILLVGPDVLSDFFMKLRIGDPRINVFHYLRGQATFFVIRIVTGYMIGEVIWRWRISKLLLKNSDKKMT